MFGHWQIALKRMRAEGEAPGNFGAGHQHINVVVHDCRDFDFVYFRRHDRILRHVVLSD